MYLHRMRCCRRRHPTAPPPRPQTDYGGRKYSGGKLPYQRVFFEFSDEPLSQPPPAAGGGGGGGTADAAQLAFVQVCPGLQVGDALLPCTCCLMAHGVHL